MDKTLWLAGKIGVFNPRNCCTSRYVTSRNPAQPQPQNLSDLEHCGETQGLRRIAALAAVDRKMVRRKVQRWITDTSTRGDG